MINRSFLYGDGFFESIFCNDGIAPLLTFHLKRAKSTAQFINATWPSHWDLSFWQKKLKPYAGTNKVRITFYRTGGGAYPPTSSDLAYEITAAPIESMIALPLAEASLQKDAAPIKLKISAHPKPNHWMLQHKFTSAMWYVKVAADAHLETNEGLVLLNADKKVVEELHNNIIVKIDGKYFTPPNSDGPLRGVFVTYLRSIMNIEFKSITLDQFQRADEIWLVNAVRGMRKAVLL